MTVRVLRLMEYVYADAETAVADRARWQIQGTYTPSTKITIHSTTLPMEFITSEPNELPVWNEGENPPPGTYRLGQHRFRPSTAIPRICSYGCGRDKDNPIHQISRESTSDGEE